MQGNIAKLALLFGIIATIGFGTMNTAVAEPSERSGIGLGHITLVLQGADGTIKQYVQTDNVITHDGLDCLVETLFTGSTSVCSILDPFDVISIGNGNGQTATSSVLAGILASGCIAGADSSVEIVNENTPQSIIIEVVFGGATSGATIQSNICEDTITEAGLFNVGDATTTAVNMFAYQDFTGITIGASDTLTVTWDIDFA